MKISERVKNITNIKTNFLEKPNFPKAIKIEVTSRCNYSCQYCAHRLKLRKDGDIDPNFFKKIVNEAKNLGVKEIGLFGLGESTLNKKLPDYIKYTKDLGIPYVFLTTNGSVCSKNYLLKLIKSGLDSIKFSINAYNKEDYKINHGQNNFNKIIERVSWLYNYKKENNLKLNVCISSIYDKKKIKEAENFKNTIKHIVDDFYFLPLYNQGGFVPNSSAIEGNPGMMESLVSPVPCYKLFNFSNISWDGWMEACCFDFGGEFRVANLEKTTLMEAWNSEKFIKIRKSHLSRKVCGPCIKCLGLK